MRFAGPLFRARRDDDDGGIRVIVRGADVKMDRRHKRQSVREIEDSPCEVGVEVDDGDLRPCRPG